MPVLFVCNSARSSLEFNGKTVNDLERERKRERKREREMERERERERGRERGGQTFKSRGTGLEHENA